jgi:hypothetical protein
MSISYEQKQQTHETRGLLNQTEKQFVLRRSDINLWTHKYIFFSTYLIVCVGAHKAFQKGRTEWGEGGYKKYKVPHIPSVPYSRK